MQQQLKKVLTLNKSKISFTTDIWTSPNQVEYMAITYHYINDDFNLKSGLLDFFPFPGSHTGEDIARMFVQVLIKFGIVVCNEIHLDSDGNLSKTDYANMKNDNTFFDDSKVFSITTDNAANNGTFIASLSRSIGYNEELWTRCFPHVLNLVVKEVHNVVNTSKCKLKLS